MAPFVTGMPADWDPTGQYDYFACPGGCGRQVVHPFHWKTMPLHEKREALEDGFACAMEKDTSICRRCGGLEDIYEPVDWVARHMANYEKWTELRDEGHVRTTAARAMGLSFEQLRQSIRYVHRHMLVQSP